MDTITLKVSLSITTYQDNILSLMTLITSSHSILFLKVYFTHERENRERELR